MVHKLTDAMSSAQKLRGAGLTPHFHAERSSNCSCGSSAASAELTRQVEKSTPAAYELHESRPVSSARGNWQLTVRCPQLSTRVSLAVPRMVSAGAKKKTSVRFEAYPSMFSPWFPATWLAQRAWTA